MADLICLQVFCPCMVQVVFATQNIQFSHYFASSINHPSILCWSLLHLSQMKLTINRARPWRGGPQSQSGFPIKIRIKAPVPVTCVQHITLSPLSSSPSPSTNARPADSNNIFDYLFFLRCCLCAAKV